MTKKSREGMTRKYGSCLDRLRRITGVRSTCKRGKEQGGEEKQRNGIGHDEQRDIRERVG